MKTKIILFFLLLFSVMNAGKADISVRHNKEIRGCFSHTIHITGEITFADVSRFQNILNQLKKKYGPKDCLNSELWIQLNSLGGEVLSAIQLGRLFRINEVTTVVSLDSECSSSCVFLLAGGVNRIVAGKVGIHRPFFSDLDPKLSTTIVREKRNQMTKEIRQYLDEMDISQNLLDQMIAVPPEEMRYLAFKDLRELRLNIIDPTFDERRVAQRAWEHDITSAEYRRRDSLAETSCGSVIEDVNKRMNCQGAILYGLSLDEFQRRTEQSRKICKGLSDTEKLSCFRKVLTKK
jgi:hypothetical protein